MPGQGSRRGRAASRARIFLGWERGRSLPPPRLGPAAEPSPRHFQGLTSALPRRGGGGGCVPPSGARPHHRLPAWTKPSSATGTPNPRADPATGGPGGEGCCQNGCRCASKRWQAQRKIKQNNKKKREMRAGAGRAPAVLLRARSPGSLRYTARHRRVAELQPLGMLLAAPFPQPGPSPRNTGDILLPRR